MRISGERTASVVLRRLRISIGLSGTKMSREWLEEIGVDTRGGAVEVWEGSKMADERAEEMPLPLNMLPCSVRGLELAGGGGCGERSRESSVASR